MRVGWALPVLALLLALAVPAQAAPGTLAARVELPVEVLGGHQATGDDGAFLLEGAAGEAVITLAAEHGVLNRVQHRAWGYVNPTDPQLKVVWDDDTRTLPLSLDGAVLTVHERRAGFRLLAHDGPLSLASGDHGAPLLVGALDATKSIEHALDPGFSVHLPPRGLLSEDDRFTYDLPAGTLQARADDGAATADGPVRLYLSDAVVGYLGPDGIHDLPAHFRVEMQPGTVYNPLTKQWSGPGEHVEYVQEHLLIDARAAHLDVRYAGTPASLFASRAAIAVDGTALLPAATGTVTITEDGKTSEHALRGDDLALGGRFALRLGEASGTPATTQADGEGDITAVTYSGVAATYDWTAAAVATGLGAVVLAAVGWILSQAKTASAAAGGLIAGYARVSGQEVLEHPGRQEVYERVKAFPGVSFVQLADQVSFGASTLNYHLRVLEKNEYITSVKDGRYIRFFDRQGGAYAGARKHAVSALRNTTTAAIARHIKAHPGVPQRDLAAAFGVTASTVNWHVSRLAAAGLVTRTRDAHFTRYYVSEGWGQLPADEVQRQDAAAAPPVAPLVVA